MYQFIGQSIIKDVMEGYNGTIFAYGQTGSGKSYTMMGSDIYDEELQGIIPRSVMTVFNEIETVDIETEFTIRCSMLEIYRERLNDLLIPQDMQINLKIKEAPQRGIYVDGLTEECVGDPKELFECIDYGNSNRKIASTEMNSESSRSHSLFFLCVEQKFTNGTEKKGQLNLVDLAGSEKIHKTKVEGENLEEAKKINLSLSALGNVINSLTSGKDHIPYRDSKLTRLLQESLGGNYKTTLMVACSPHPRNFEETISTLKFAIRAKTIKNKPKVNVKRSAAYYIKKIECLKKDLREKDLKINFLSNLI